MDIWKKMWVGVFYLNTVYITAIKCRDFVHNFILVPSFFAILQYVICVPACLTDTLKELTCK